MVYLIAFSVFLLMVLLMSIGVMARRKPIQGSCGGLAKVEIDKVCHCETPCQDQTKSTQTDDLK